MTDPEVPCAGPPTCDGCPTCDPTIDGPDPDAQRDAERDLKAVDREQWHKDAIAAAGRYVQKHPEMVDDYSDADPGL